MSPEIIGVCIGIAFIFPTIYILRKTKLEAHAWPAFLVTLPIYYMLFGLLAFDLSAITKELLYGLPFIASGLLVWKIKNRTTLMIIAIGWLAHGFYDYYHDVLFINPGVFSWYPAFCAFVDIVVGLYLLKHLNQQPFTTSNTEYVEKI
ncbi:hypothetical protein EYS14_06885 [Alteromonadaceae bacterium M269]|nr:hypothetical protein EYS14_06885 [Alteromonadaceae bacterium M269]